MKKRKQNLTLGITSDLELAKKMAREQRLKEGKQHGFPRSKIWGGKPNYRAIRRNAKIDIRKETDK